VEGLVTQIWVTAHYLRTLGIGFHEQRKYLRKVPLQQKG